MRPPRQNRVGRKPINKDDDTAPAGVVDFAWVEQLQTRVQQLEQRQDTIPVFKNGVILGDNSDPATPPDVSAPIDYPIDGVHLKADTVTSGHIASQTIAVGKFIMSSNYSVGVSGWAIDGNGNAEFNDVTVRGIFQTGASGGRVVLEGDSASNPGLPGIDVFTGHTGEDSPGGFWAFHTGANASDTTAEIIAGLVAPDLTPGGSPSILFFGKAANGTSGINEIVIDTDRVHIDDGGLAVDGEVHLWGASTVHDVLVVEKLDVFGTGPDNVIQGDWGGNAPALRTRSGGNVVTFDWDGANIKFYVDNTHVKTL